MYKQVTYQTLFAQELRTTLSSKKASVEKRKTRAQQLASGFLLILFILFIFFILFVLFECFGDLPVQLEASAITARQ